MASAFAMSPIQHPRTKLSGMEPIDPRAFGAVRRRRKETVNERVEHILRGALRDAEEEALQEREGDPEARGRALQRSHQLASLYTTSTDHKFVRSRAKRDATIQHCKEAKAKRHSQSSIDGTKSRVGSNYEASVIGEGNESDESDHEPHSVCRLVLASPIKPGVSCGGVQSQSPVSPIAMVSPDKPAKPWYGTTTATLKEPIPQGITLDAKLRRYGARGTAKLSHGWRSQEALEPLSPSPPGASVDEYVSGLSGSPSFWPPEAFHPTGSNLRVTMTRCPSSPIAVSVQVPNADSDRIELCHSNVKLGNLQQKASQKLQSTYKREVQVEREEHMRNKHNLAAWQSRTIHFAPSSELAAHREQQKEDLLLRHRRTQVSAIVQTPGYSPDKQHSKESGELKSKRFKLRWRSFSMLLDAMRRTPCRRPVLQDMEKLFGLARELCALNAVGTCMLSRTQFTLLVTREFPLCDIKHVNRLFSSYDWQIRDAVDARTILGAMRAMRVQQGEPVELICSTLRDFDDTSAKTKTSDDKAVVSNGSCLAKALSLCCATDLEEREMESRADVIWTKTLSWQRQIMTRRVHGGVQHNVWKAPGAKSSVSSTAFSKVTSDNCNEDDVTSRAGDVEINGGDEDGEDDEDSKEELPELIQLVDESRVPIRRIREALKRERETLTLFTQQLLERRHECLVGANTRSPRQ